MMDGGAGGGRAGVWVTLMEKGACESAGRVEVLCRLFFFQAEDGMRDYKVTGVQTCALLFSSRRRHTRLQGDWSSDVCSSELVTEGLEPHKVKEVFLSGAVPPDTWVDVGDTLVLKCAALRAHVSQVGTGDWVDTLLRDWAVRDGKRAGVQYAEAYRRLVLRSGT